MPHTVCRAVGPTSNVAGAGSHSDAGAFTHVDTLAFGRIKSPPSPGEDYEYAFPVYTNGTRLGDDVGVVRTGRSTDVLPGACARARATS